MRFLPAVENAFDIRVLAAFARRDFDQLKGHIFRKTTQIFRKSRLNPVGHLRADSDKLQLHALTPEFFQFIQAATFFLHDMHNHIAQIDDNPVSRIFAFDAQWQSYSR